MSEPEGRGAAWTEERSDEGRRHPGAPRGLSGQTQVTLGLFDWIDADGAREPGQLYRERLDLLAAAEAHGFDIYHLAEHHGTPLGLAPSPNVFLAAAAARTTRIRLSALVYVLPLYDPVRLAEEIAMLDQLSDGRLEVGLGKGGNPYELLPYGIGADEAQQRYDDVLAVVLRALQDHESPLRPRQRPYPPLWYPSSNPQSVPRLGARGINTILGFSFRSPSIEETRLRRDDYFAGVAVAPAGTRLGGAGAATPRFGLMRNVYVARTDREARDRVLGAMEVFYAQFTALWRRHGDSRFWQAQDFAGAIDAGLIIAGSPATVRNRLTDMLLRSGCNHFAGAFAFGSLSLAEARVSVQRFGQEVAPALRDLSPG